MSDKHVQQALRNASMALSAMEGLLRLPRRTLSVSVVMDEGEWRRFMTSFEDLAIMRQIVEAPHRQSFQYYGITFRRAQ